MVAILVTLLLVLTLPAQGAIFYVSKGGSGEGGQTWGSAFKTVKAAAEIAGPSDDIWVKGGEYFGFVRFSGENAYGGFAGTEGPNEFHLRDWKANETILTATPHIGPIKHIVDLSGDGTLDGFTVTGGEDNGLQVHDGSPFISNCVIKENLGANDFGQISRSNGGGVYIYDASPTFNSCLITNNRTQVFPRGNPPFTYLIGNFGGGIYCTDAGFAVFRDCTISENRMDGGSDVDLDRVYGGGIFCENSKVLIEDCRVSENTGSPAVRLGYAPAKGCGVALLDCEFEIRNSQITSNISLSKGPQGGGVHINGGHGRITNTAIISNPAGETLEDGVGGGLYATDTRLHLEKCQFRNNRAEFAGGIFIRESTACITNCLLAENVARVAQAFYSVSSENLPSTSLSYCTITSNTSEYRNNNEWSAVRMVGSGEDKIENSIIWGNSADIALEASPEVVSVRYSNIQGGFPGEGNIDADPLFVDPANGNYRLRMGSPCIDSASIMGPSTDLDGNPRPVDIIGLGREAPGAFDMGAYEFQAPRSDLNSDGYVNEMDLMIFQQDWMKVSGP